MEEKKNSWERHDWQRFFCYCSIQDEDTERPELLVVPILPVRDHNVEMHVNVYVGNNESFVYSITYRALLLNLYIDY